MSEVDKRLSQPRRRTRAAARPAWRCTDTGTDGRKAEKKWKDTAETVTFHSQISNNVEDITSFVCLARQNPP